MKLNEIADLLFPKFTALPINYNWDLNNYCQRFFLNIMCIPETNYLKECKTKKLNHPNLGSKLCHCI